MKDLPKDLQNIVFDYLVIPKCKQDIHKDIKYLFSNDKNYAHYDISWLYSIDEDVFYPSRDVCMELLVVIMTRMYYDENPKHYFKCDCQDCEDRRRLGL